MVTEYSQGKSERKNRIIRYIGCVLILFVWILKNYCNLLEYVKTPAVPLLPTFFRNLDIIAIVVAYILFYILFWIMLEKFIADENKENKLKCKAVYNCIEYIISMLFLLYAVNLLIEFANKVTMPATLPFTAFFSLCYLIICLLEKKYYTYYYENNNDLNEYTDYFDKNGDRIPVNAKVCYKGRLYTVIKDENHIKLDNGTICKVGNDCLNIEDVIADGFVIIVNKNSAKIG